MSKEIKKNVHKGHRQRMKDRYINFGLDSFSPHEVLELLLYYSIPQKDTNPIAHELIDRFGSFSGVFDAPMEFIESIPGLGQSSAVLIGLIKEIYAYYLKDKRSNVKAFNNVAQIGSYLRPLFVNKNVEVVYLMCLNAKNELISCNELFSGSVNSSIFPLRDVVVHAIAQRASGVVIAHNHPNGTALPSKRDIETTRNLINSLKLVDIYLVDHLVFADDDYVSMVSSDLINNIPIDTSLNQIDVWNFNTNLDFGDYLVDDSLLPY